MAKKQADIFDAAPDGAAEMSETAVSLTKKASMAVSVFATLPAWEPHPTLVEIAKLKEEKLALIANVGTPAGLKLCKEAKREIVRLCTTVDDRRKEVGRDALEYKRGVDKVGNTVLEKLREISDPLDVAIKAEEQKEIQAALEKAQAIEKEQREKEQQRLDLLKAEEDRKKAEEQAKLDKERAELAAQRAEMDKQLAELREIKLENERLQAEARAKIIEEQRLKEEKDRAEREAKEREERMAYETKREKERAAKAEADRIENEKRMEEAKKEAAALAIKNEQARVAREAEAKRLKEEKERLAAEKKAKQAPDKEKLTKWADAIQAIERPAVKDREAEAVLKDASAVIAAAMTRVYAFCGGK